MMIAAPQATDGSTTGPRVSGWATTTLILGILSPFTCTLTTLPAIIAGIVALVEIGNSNGRLKGLGRAIAGMVLPIVLLPFVAGILMHALVRVAPIERRMACGTNLAALGKAMHIYAGDHNGRFPTPSKWCDLLSQNSQVAPTWFVCKGAAGGRCNYAMNKAVENLGDNAPANLVLLYETVPGWNQAGGLEILTVDNHQGEGCNVLFVNGQVEFIKRAGLQQLQWTAAEPPRGNQPPLP